MCLRVLATAAITFLAFALPYTAQSADISVDKQSKTLLIEGGITEGDFEKFSKVMNESTVSRVVLASRGGALREALLIGEDIARKKIATEVKSNEICASACAYIWLSGASKTVKSGGTVGFHSPYLDDGQMTVSSSGNALTGAYLARLGFNDMTIIYATEAAPREVRWLSVEDSHFLGLRVIWEGTRPSPSPNYTLTKDEIQRALTTERWARRLKQEMEPVFQELVSITYELQLNGDNWEEAMTTRLQAVVQKHPKTWAAFEKRLWATSSEGLIYKASTNVLKKARILKDKSPKACVLLFYNETPSSIDMQILFDADRMIPPDIIDEFGEIVIEALSQEPYKFKPPTAKQRRAFDKRIEKIFLDVFNNYKRKERNAIEAAFKGTRSNERLLCTFLIKVTETLMKSPKDFIMNVRLDN